MCNKELSDDYETILKPFQTSLVIQRSKFYSFVEHVDSEDDARRVIRDYKKKYYDSTHVCSAYVIGPDREICKGNDDGEPSGTAGRPILGQIQSRKLSNVIVLVVRYFGGILLGSSGLIKAYKQSAADVLEIAEVVEVPIPETVCVRFNYELFNEVFREVKKFSPLKVEQNFEENCIMTITVKRSKAELLRSNMAKIYGVKVVD